jgi:hypothetical protein
LGRADKKGKDCFFYFPNKSSLSPFIPIHEYFGVDLAVVWKTVEKDLPPLIQSIKQVLKEIDCLKE